MRRSTASALSRTKAEIVWDPIAAIEPLPPEPVYDIEVEGTHNFLANGIVAHNSTLGPATEAGPTVPPTATTTKTVGDALQADEQTKPDL